MFRALSVLLLATALAGCSKTPEAAKISLSQVPAAAPVASGDALVGPVLEHLSAPPYVYLRLKTSQGEVWAAVPEVEVEKGVTVTVFNPMLMTNFESKSLKRTFPEVYFGALAPAGGASSGGTGDPHAGTQRSAAVVNAGQVEKATGADARTVSEVWAGKADLVGKTVTIRGVVVKFNESVMARNWIHLQDGSGDATSGTNDITVTSLDGAALGETVTIRGTVHTNKDFGAGYTYAVIVEDAKVTRK